MLSFDETQAIDRRHIWHPFTQMKDYAAHTPPSIVRGEGIFLFDAQGNRYYDTISSWWTNLLGHCHPELSATIAEQAARLEHVNFSGFTHPYAAGLVQRIVDLLPAPLTRAFFSDDGSTAVEVALKMAFQYWQNRGVTTKTRFVQLRDAYHGDTLGAVSVGGVSLYHELYKPLMFATHTADAPHCNVCPHRRSAWTYDAEDTGCTYECFASMEEIIATHHKEIAAVILEPILQGAGGMHIYPAEYLRKVRALCDAYDVLLICDEVATGFGRTGRMFACEHAGIAPDIICLSKGITGGTMPLALTVATEAIYDAFYDDWQSMKTFFHGHSYTAHPLACAVAETCLTVLARENLPESAQPVMSYFHEKLREFTQYAWVGDVRYRGVVGAIDIVQDRATHTPLPPTARLSWVLHRAGLAQGVVLRPLGEMVYWFLPLTVTRDDIDEILRRSLAAINAAFETIYGTND